MREQLRAEKGKMEHKGVKGNWGKYEMGRGGEKRGKGKGPASQGKDRRRGKGMGREGRLKKGDGRGEQGRPSYVE